MCKNKFSMCFAVSPCVPWFASPAAPRGKLCSHTETLSLSACVCFISHLHGNETISYFTYLWEIVCTWGKSWFTHLTWWLWKLRHMARLWRRDSARSLPLSLKLPRFSDCNKECSKSVVFSGWQTLLVSFKPHLSEEDEFYQSGSIQDLTLCF